MVVEVLMLVGLVVAEVVVVVVVGVAVVVVVMKQTTTLTGRGRSLRGLVSWARRHHTTATPSQCAYRYSRRQKFAAGLLFWSKSVW